MNRQNWLKFLASLSFALALLFNVILRFAASSGRLSMSVLPKSNFLFAPADFTYYCWVLIAVLLAFYLLYSWNVLRRPKSEFARQFVLIADIGLLLASLANIAFVLAFYHAYALVAFVFNVTQVFVLIRVSLAYQGNLTKPYWGRFPFDLYLGWVHYLSFVYGGYILATWNWNLLARSPAVWAIILLLLQSFSSTVLALKMLSPASLLPNIWGIGGLVYAQLSPRVWDGQFPAIYICAIFCMAFLAASSIVCLIKRRRRSWR